MPWVRASYQLPYPGPASIDLDTWPRSDLIIELIDLVGNSLSISVLVIPNTGYVTGVAASRSANSATTSVYLVDFVDKKLRFVTLPGGATLAVDLPAPYVRCIASPDGATLYLSDAGGVLPVDVSSAPPRLGRRLNTPIFASGYNGMIVGEPTLSSDGSRLAVGVTQGGASPALLWTSTEGWDGGAGWDEPIFLAAPTIIGLAAAFFVDDGANVVMWDHVAARAFPVFLGEQGQGDSAQMDPVTFVQASEAVSAMNYQRLGAVDFARHRLYLLRETAHEEALYGLSFDIDESSFLPFPFPATTADLLAGDSDIVYPRMVCVDENGIVAVLGDLYRFNPTRGGIEVGLFQEGEVFGTFDPVSQRWHAPEPSFYTTPYVVDCCAVVVGS
jgi:hypothetical protein